MYEKFHVKNFRCFADLQVGNLGRINLIAGKNNVGKTALLEAMYLLAGNRDSRTMLRRIPSIRRRFPRDYEPESRSIVSLSTIFKNFATAMPIEISADAPQFAILKKNHEPSISLKISNVPEFSYSRDKRLIELLDRRFGESDEGTEVLKLDSSLDKHPHYLLLENGHLQRSRTKQSQLCTSCLLAARDAVSARDTAERFLRLQNAKDVAVLVGGLNVIEPDLVDLRLSTDDIQPYLDADIGLPRLIALKNLGDGMNRMADVILGMHKASNGIIFIDEIENGFHHSIHENVWRTIDEISDSLNVQVFATTHSAEMIAAANEAFKDDDVDDFRFHRLYRDSTTGNIEARTYNEYSIDAAISRDREVRG